MKENLKPYVYKHTKHDKCDVVLFVERSGEFMYVARLSTSGTEPQGNPSVNSATVTCIRPETG